MELPVKAPVNGDKRGLYRIETKNLSYSFESPSDKFSWFLSWRMKVVSPRFIIKNVNLAVKPGEITAIAGLSGAGKTTLLEILAVKISPQKVSGHGLIDGRSINGETFQRLSGHVTQDNALFPLLTVEETLIFSALQRLPGGKREASRRVEVLMKDLGLDHLAGSRIGEGCSQGISGGERRRLSIGVELAHDPAVLLIDEPTSGLDSASSLRIIAVLKLMAVNQLNSKNF